MPAGLPAAAAAPAAPPKITAAPTPGPACQDTIDRAGLPAHTVQFGAKGCVTWAPEHIRNYRDYKATDFDLAFAQWIHGINRGILLPPGLDCEVGLAEGDVFGGHG